MSFFWLRTGIGCRYPSVEVQGSLKHAGDDRSFLPGVPAPGDIHTPRRPHQHRICTLLCTSDVMPVLRVKLAKVFHKNTDAALRSLVGSWNHVSLWHFLQFRQTCTDKAHLLIPGLLRFQGMEGLQAGLVQSASFQQAARLNS